MFYMILFNIYAISEFIPRTAQLVYVTCTQKCPISRPFIYVQILKQSLCKIGLTLADNDRISSGLFKNVIPRTQSISAVRIPNSGQLITKKKVSWQKHLRFLLNIIILLTYFCGDHGIARSSYYFSHDYVSIRTL